MRNRGHKSARTPCYSCPRGQPGGLCRKKPAARAIALLAQPPPLAVYPAPRMTMLRRIETEICFSLTWINSSDTARGETCQNCSYDGISMGQMKAPDVSFYWHTPSAAFHASVPHTDACQSSHSAARSNSPENP
jgi:hypothetical protein